MILDLKKRVVVIVALLSLCSLGLCAQEATDEVSVKIARYRGDKQCAISYTFDDGLREHFTLAAPILEQLGFRGTFWINGAKINDDSTVGDTTRMRWSEVKQMSDRGHELSNHGWAHRKLTRLSLSEVTREIERNDTAIYLNTGLFPTTFCYPYNSRNEEIVKIASQRRVATRTEQIAVGGCSPVQKLDRWIENTISAGKWGVGMTHGITYGYDAFADISIFKNHLMRVKSLEDRIWIDTFSQVAAYIKERDEIRCQVTKTKKGFLIMPELALDSKLFNAPLTMIVDIVSENKIKVRQGGSKLTVTQRSADIIFDFDPHAGAITISR